MNSKIFNKDNIDIIYYHKGCPDGSCALNVILHYLYSNKSKEEVDKIQCIPMSHPYTVDNAFFENARDRNVVMVDFSLKRSDLKRLIDVSKTFLILDHHKTAYEDLADIDPDLKVFRMDKSGAGLACDYFFVETERPKVVTFIEDQDIWTFKDADTKAFNTVFHGLNQDYDLWLSYLTNPDLVQETINKGRAMLEYETTLVNNSCDWYGQVKIHDINGVYAIIANLNSRILTSQIG